MVNPKGSGHINAGMNSASFGVLPAECFSLVAQASLTPACALLRKKATTHRVLLLGICMYVHLHVPQVQSVLLPAPSPAYTPTLNPMHVHVCAAGAASWRRRCSSCTARPLKHAASSRSL